MLDRLILLFLLAGMTPFWGLFLADIQRQWRRR